MLVASAIILTLAAVIQVSVGFGAALFAIPILLWLDWSLPQCHVLLMTAMLSQNCIGLWKTDTKIPLKDGLTVGLVRAACIPIGLVGLIVLVAMPSAILKAILGVVLLIAIGIQFLQSRNCVRPDDSPDPIWKWLAASGSGVLQGSIGISGPPLVLWVYRNPWTIDRTRAVLFVVFLVGYPVQTTIWFLSFGNEVLPALNLGLALTPIVAGASLAGVWLRSKASEQSLRGFVRALLVLIALTCIFPAVRLIMQ